MHQHPAESLSRLPWLLSSLQVTAVGVQKSAFAGFPPLLSAQQPENVILWVATHLLPCNVQ